MMPFLQYELLSLAACCFNLAREDILPAADIPIPFTTDNEEISKKQMAELVDSAIHLLVGERVILKIERLFLRM